MSGDEDNASTSSRSSPANVRPVGTASRRRRGQRYKTELCRQFEESGSCCYGPRCQFAHGRVELRSVARHPKYKTDLCRPFHTTGLCPYGARCHFIHNDDDGRRTADPTFGLEPPSTDVRLEFDVEQRLLGFILLVLDPSVILELPGQLLRPREDHGFDLRFSAASGVKELVDSRSCGDVARWSQSSTLRSADIGSDNNRTWSSNPRNELIS